MIHLENVTKLYKTVVGVNEINVKLEEGIYGLLGPNGSGKTTLINLILGQLKPTLGKVRLFGENPWRQSQLLRRVGLCPSLEVNYPLVTGLDWVTYMVELHGFNFPAAKRLAKDALEAVKLTDAMNRPMRNYSLGMRQRAKIAQAIAHDPDLLILDEPFSGLDPIGRHEMSEYLKAWATKGKSLILASHILHEVEAVKPSFLLISGGRLLASGSPAEVRSILTSAPSRLVIRSSDAKKLASYLIDECPLDGIEFSTDGQLVVTTRQSQITLNSVTHLAASGLLEVFEITSTDDSLKTLFSTLMKIHRGELEYQPQAKS
ncbi:ABC transporter ATP-binding protein [Mariniblastus sp.]|nr:ABC transporter ATP-binding protein [Mariniblastus sp.]